MGEHEKVEVVEKHYHHGEKEKSGDGKATAALITSIATAAAGAIPLVGGAVKKVFGDGGGANVAAQIASTVLPAIASMAMSSRPSEPRVIPFPMGNRFPFGNDETETLRAEVARLQAEKYSDNAAKEESNRLLVNYLKPYGDAISANFATVATLQAEINCAKRTSELEKKNLELQIELVKQDAKCCCEKNAAELNVIKSLLGGITKTVIPADAVCTARLG